MIGSGDHGVTHSLYITDPDGNEIELYIDVSPRSGARTRWPSWPRCGPCSCSAGRGRGRAAQMCSSFSTSESAYPSL